MGTSGVEGVQSTLHIIAEVFLLSRSATTMHTAAAAGDATS